MGLPKPPYVQNPLVNRELFLNIACIGSQTQPSIKTFCKNIGEVLVYNEDDSRVVTAVDAGIGFALTDLDNDAPPAVLGFLIPCGDAAELTGVRLIENSIKNFALSAPMTALGTVTFKGALAVGNAITQDGVLNSGTGITASNNIAFIAALTSWNIDEDNATAINHEFWLKVAYRTTQPAY